MNTNARHTAQGTPALPAEGNWYPPNLQRIAHALQGLAAQSSGPLAAVFDFDNTCIFRDIGRAIFRIQLLQLHCRLAPETLAMLLPERPIRIGTTDLRLVRAQLLADYAELHPLLAAGRRAEALQHPAHARFAALMLWYAQTARTLPELGSGHVVTLLARLLAGFSLREQQSLTRQAITGLLAEPLDCGTVRAEFPPPLGALESSFELGLRPHDEMRSLMAWLGRVGIGCYLVSASSRSLVQAAAAELGFPVPPEHIFGLRLQTGEDGRCLAELSPDIPITYRGGKAEIIRRHIPGTPVLVAGDADTDYEMLVLPDIPVRLLINRCQTGLIRTLYNDPGYILQGIDRIEGRFRPHRETV